MAQMVNLKLRGLYTFPNDLSEVPEGALVVADNIVIDRDSIAEPRRGFAQFGSNFSVTNEDRANQLLEYKDRILVHYADSPNGKLAYDSTGNGVFVDYSGTFNSASDARIKSAEQNGNLYITTSTGITKISTASAANLGTALITEAGAAKALDVRFVSLTTPGSAVAQDKQVAYRVVWGYNDPNDVLVLGAPSGRLEVNTAGAGATSDVNLIFNIPDSIISAPNASDYFFQLYRTAPVDTGTGFSPDEEYYLVLEDFPTAPQLAAKEVTVADTYDDGLRASSTLLYTNPVSGEGIAQANERPPFAKDIGIYKQYTFYANTSTVQRLTLTLLNGNNDVPGGSPPGVIGETITIDDGVTSTPQTYEFISDAGPENNGDILGNGNVAVRTSGLPTVGQQIAETAQNLIEAINTTVNEEVVYAYYLSGSDDLPGQILFEQRATTGAAFTITGSVNLQGIIGFDPQLGASGQTSDNEVRGNRIYYSKFQQPDSVPLVNYFDVGPRDKAILRIVPLRDSLFVFKEDAIYRVTGTVAPFQVTLFDSSAQIVAPDSAAILNNQVYCLTTQGIVAVSDTGVQVISRPIEDRMLDIIQNITANSTQTVPFAVTYESDRAYLLWAPEVDGEGVSSQCYRYNTFTRTWTRWPISKRCAVINQIEDKLYLGPQDENFIEQERKNRDRTDHADRNFTRSIIVNTVSSNVLEISSKANVNVGDTLVQTQQITVAKFNQLIDMLGNDANLPNPYTKISVGSNINAAMLALTNNFDNDTTNTLSLSNYNALYTGAPSQLAGFNAVLTNLNADASTFLTNYNAIGITSTTEYEAIITDISVFGNTVTLNSEQPFIAGDVEVYECIDTNVTWDNNTMGDVTLFKQVSEGTVIFKDNNFSSAEVGYSTDLSPGFESITFNGAGSGDWGQFTWGQQNWGGISAAKPLRTLIPRQKQRCRFISPRFKHCGAREKYSLQGMSLTFRPYRTRAYR